MIVPLTPSVIGGQAPPTIMDPTTRGYSYDGWYYKKTLTDPINNKINWYVAPDINMKVSDIKQIYFEMYLINNGSQPFITVYTKPTGDKDMETWYHSKRTYEKENNSQLLTNTNYCCYKNINSNDIAPVSYGHTSVKFDLDSTITIDYFTTSPRTTTPNKGDFAANEEILFFAFGTDSSAGINRVEFICKSINVKTSKGTTNFVLSNVQVDIAKLQGKDLLYEAIKI